MTIDKVHPDVKVWLGFLFNEFTEGGILKIRAADAKEVGVGNPAEETCCYPNEFNVTIQQHFVNKLMRIMIKKRGFWKLAAFHPFIASTFSLK